MKRKILLLGIDLFWVALSPFVALFIRENFAPRAETLEAAFGYALAGVIAGMVVLPLAGLNRGLWRYTSLPDLTRVVVAATAIVMLSLFATFAFSRLEDVARSMPLIQWFVLLACMVGTRIGIRIWQERRQHQPKDFLAVGDHQNVLVVGVSQVAELYLRAAKDLAPHTVSVVGFLALGKELPGRLLRSHKVLGQPEDLPEVMRQLEIHGAPLDRIVVVEPLSQLSRQALDALLNVERSSTVKVEWMPELLGLTGRQDQRDLPVAVRRESPVTFDLVPALSAKMSIASYRRAKRVMDIVGAAILIVILAPLIASVAVLTAFDVGHPIVFWQKRPGRNGYVFRLYKFRSMRGAHDQAGKRIPDLARSSRLGEFLRRSRLDELPQLYNILMGEMSFIGPRPLLPIDHASDGSWGLLVRPGLTGWAQVRGGRQLSVDDKAALDVWYVQHMSFGLDVGIAFRTLAVILSGEKVDHDAISSAREEWSSRKSRGLEGLTNLRPGAGHARIVQA